jgi:hypothetical protein
VPKRVVSTAASKTANVSVTVNGKPWQLVSNLADSGQRDRVFTVGRTSGGKTVARFGDGIHGARPPVRGTITIDYRSGSGPAGNAVTVVFQMVARPTIDQALWVAIRNRTRAISFEFR